MRRIIVGSMTDVKLDAATAACVVLKRLAHISGRKTKSGQPEQPEGLEQIIAGAMHRAQQIIDEDSNCTALGIENGIIEVMHRFFDLACVVILVTGQAPIIVFSIAVECPRVYVDKARAFGFDKVTVGHVIARELGGDPHDPHSVISKGAVTRKGLLTDAIVAALGQLDWPAE